MILKLVKGRAQLGGWVNHEGGERSPFDFLFSPPPSADARPSSWLYVDIHIKQFLHIIKNFDQDCFQIIFFYIRNKIDIEQFQHAKCVRYT